MTALHKQMRGIILQIRMWTEINADHADLWPTISIIIANLTWV